MINSELCIDNDQKELQLRITKFITERFPQNEKLFLAKQLASIQSKTGLTVIIWGKRYVLDFMKYTFLNYLDGESVNTSPEEEVRIFKAYLIICEELNEKDNLEFKKLDIDFVNDEFSFEKLVWPFLLKQFDNNNQVDALSQFFKLMAFLKYSILDLEIMESWRKFIKFNGFNSMQEYVNSVNFLITIGLHLNQKNQYFKKFSWIKSDTIPTHLLNLSFNISEFNNDKTKRVDYKGFREKPLFQSNKNEFVILDNDFLLNKIYNGPLFDLYNNTGMAANTRFKQFHDFKTHIGTHVSEEIVFKGIIKKLFSNKKNNHPKVIFDDLKKVNYPDCYIRDGKKIFLIEFKDYLFPGNLVDEYSCEKIKSHVDLKFIKNAGGSNKGISQILEQIKIITSSKFDFDNFVETDITIIPLVVHTNFTYQLPGINSYLNVKFQNLLKTEIPNLKAKVKNLVLIDIESLFDLLEVKKMNLSFFEMILNRYEHILKNRFKRLRGAMNQDNFVMTRESFDTIYKSKIAGSLERMDKTLFRNNLMEITGINEEILNFYN